MDSPSVATKFESKCQSSQDVVAAVSAEAGVVAAEALVIDVVAAEAASTAVNQAILPVNVHATVVMAVAETEMAMAVVEMVDTVEVVTVIADAETTVTVEVVAMTDSRLVVDSEGVIVTAAVRHHPVAKKRMKKSDKTVESRWLPQWQSASTRQRRH